MKRLTPLIITLTAILASCGETNEHKTLFSLLEAAQTGINFSNTITETDTFNIFSHTYMYNGSGVGVGDFNNDGLKDLYFAGNMTSSKLYINQDRLRFEDVTEESGAAAAGKWCTGVSVIDINGDGFDDIYVSVADIYETGAGKNLLFINNGDLTFTEMAGAYRIDDEGYSTQAAFFDCDKDGDLDLYLLNNYPGTYAVNIPKPRVTDGSAKSVDKLYRNDGAGPDNHPVFSDVSADAGILIEGHGLGLTVSDINLDGWPDIYAANDFLTNDLLWINNGDGTFTNKAAEYLDHQSMFGMGVDVSDFNNDGLSDIMALDMMPSEIDREKLMMGAQNYDKFNLNLDFKYEPQYIRNTLQLNNGVGQDGKFSFSEIGQLAGIHSTDWSWGPLFADLDHDGLKDLFISNGYPKDIIDLDYIVYRSSAAMFSTGRIDPEKMKEIGNKLAAIKVPNFVFKYEGDYRFTDMTKEWGIEYPSMSNGAVFCDLDNDGDLDLVTNNINQEAFLFKNNLAEQRKDSAHYIKIVLKGPASNNKGIGSKIWLKTGDLNLYHDHGVIRGYTSSVDPDVHFGLGKYAVIDTLRIQWPDDSWLVFTNIKADTTLIADHKHSSMQYRPAKKRTGKPILEEISERLNIDFQHQESDFVDFKIQPLLPHKFSQGGPAVAVGDLNGDDLDDFIVGGSVRVPSYIFYQQPDGVFKQTVLDDNKPSEDMGLLVFDADGDGDNDVYAVSGGNEFFKNHENYRDRLYINQGDGRFVKETLSHSTESGSSVTAADFDRDGDLDIFVGARLIPREYPLTPNSLLLENRNGQFVDVTDDKAAGLRNSGLVCASLWTDFDNDGWVDLIVAGEWMPLTFYRNEQGKLVDITRETGLANTEGWWNSLAGADFDLDGDIDYIAGNFGLNHKYNVTPETPVQVYAKDFDGNGSVDPVQTYYAEGVEVTEHPRDALIDQMNMMRGKFRDYASYAEATFAEVLDENQLNNSLRLKAVNLNTSYIENKGGGKFVIKSLPVRTQFAPVYGIAISDFNADGAPDLFLTGNSYARETNYGWQDALKGALFTGNGKGGFDYLSLEKSGLRIKEDSKALAEITINSTAQTVWLASNNRGPLHIYAADPDNTRQIIRLQPSDASAVLTYENGKKQKAEFYFGHGYLSQSSRTVQVPRGVQSIEIMDFQGNTRAVSPQRLTAGSGSFRTD